MGKILERQARDFIMDQIRENGWMTSEDIVKLIRPHCVFDPQKIMEQALRRKANHLVAQVHDENGVRTVFNCKVDGVSKYVNLDICEDLRTIKNVESQLWEKANGTKASAVKASRRCAEVAGQMKLDLEQMK